MKRKKLRRRIRRLEARLNALERRKPTIWTDVPPAVYVDLDPPPPVSQPEPAVVTSWFEDEDDWRGGVYL